MAERQFPDAARLYTAAGDRGAAQAAIERAFEAERGDDRRIEWLERLGRRLGLTVPEAPAVPRWGVQGPHWYTEEAWEVRENPNHAYTVLGRRGLLAPRKTRLAAVAGLRVHWIALSAA